MISDYFFLFSDNEGDDMATSPPCTGSGVCYISSKDHIIIASLAVILHLIEFAISKLGDEQGAGGKPLHHRHSFLDYFISHSDVYSMGTTVFHMMMYDWLQQIKQLLRNIILACKVVWREPAARSPSCADRLMRMRRTAWAPIFSFCVGVLSVGSQVFVLRFICLLTLQLGQPGKVEKIGDD